jgi:RNA polymerase sigma-70 factor, ECF subfamily
VAGRGIQRGVATLTRSFWDVLYDLVVTSVKPLSMERAAETRGAARAEASAATLPVDEPGFVASLRSGDAGAFERLVRECGGRMLAVARRMLRSDADAQDAVQEAYLSAFKALPRFQGDSKVSTWLHRILVNVCLMRIRTRSRRPERSIEGLLPAFKDDGHFAARPVAWAGADRSADDEEAAMVREAIAELPESYREVVVLRDIVGADTAEAARHLGTSENNVKTRLHRARLALKAIVEEKRGGRNGEGTA